MPYPFTHQFVDLGLTYQQYWQHIRKTLECAPSNETEKKMRPHLESNSSLMDKYDKSYIVSDGLKTALNNAPQTEWILISEGWCGDAAFNVPMMALIEKAMPHKIKLHIYLRDTNTELIDAYLTEGGRSIPKLIVLDKNLIELGIWGPRPSALQVLMKQWKAEGLPLMELISRVHKWYDQDQTRSLQDELLRLVSTYSAHYS